MRVRIYSPAPSAAQSGKALSYHWVVELEPLSARLPDPLMGWASSKDTTSSLRGKLCFLTQEDAMSFVKNKGWEVVFLEKSESTPLPKSYQNNFRIIRPQDEETWAYTQ